jgi:hypothetical protein
MASVQQKAQRALWYAELKSVVAVQRHARRTYGEDKTTVRWHNQFKDTGDVKLKKH